MRMHHWANELYKLMMTGRKVTNADVETSRENHESGRNRRRKLRRQAPFPENFPPNSLKGKFARQVHARMHDTREGRACCEANIAFPYIMYGRYINKYIYEIHMRIPVRDFVRDFVS